MAQFGRRQFLAGSGALLAAPLVGAQPATPRRIAVLLPGTCAGYRSRLQVFLTELKSLGHVEGRDFVLELRWAEDQMGRLPALAALQASSLASRQLPAYPLSSPRRAGSSSRASWPALRIRAAISPV